MKNKKVQLLVLVLVLVVLGLVAKRLISRGGSSDIELVDFAVADTSSINKLIISDSYNHTIELIRGKDGIWADKEGNCVSQDPINIALETIKNLEFKGYVPEGSREFMTKKMLAKHTRVDIFVKGDLVKTWYIGASTQDHYGTYMLLETPDAKSDQPVIMHMRGLNGIIEPRFFADKRKWACTQVLSLSRDQIKEVDVKFTETKERSFSIKRNGKKFEVRQEGRIVERFDTMMIAHYLNNFKNVNFELVNFELSDKQVDSIKKSKPFCVLSVKELTGKSTQLKMFRLKGPGYKEVDDFGDSVLFDTNRFWLLTPSGNLVKAQYFAFGPMIMGHLYFATKPE